MFTTWTRSGPVTLPRDIEGVIYSFADREMIIRLCGRYDEKTRIVCGSNGQVWENYYHRFLSSVPPVRDYRDLVQQYWRHEDLNSADSPEDRVDASIVFAMHNGYEILFKKHFTQWSQNILAGYVLESESEFDPRHTLERADIIYPALIHEMERQDPRRPRFNVDIIQYVDTQIDHQKLLDVVNRLILADLPRAIDDILTRLTPPERENIWIWAASAVEEANLDMYKLIASHLTPQEIRKHPKSLLNAIWSGDLSIIQKFLDAGIDPNDPELSDISDSDLPREIADLLLEHGWDEESYWRYRIWHDGTNNDLVGLTEAIETSDSLGYDIDSLIQVVYNKNILYLGGRKRNDENIIKYLLEQGAHVTKKDIKWTVHHNNSNVLRLLLSHSNFTASDMGRGFSDIVDKRKNLVIIRILRDAGLYVEPENRTTQR